MIEGDISSEIDITIIQGRIREWVQVTQNKILSSWNMRC